MPWRHAACATNWRASGKRCRTNPPPTARPTLRWVFQLLEGSHSVRLTMPGKVHDLIEGLNEVPMKSLRLLGEEVCRLYHISPSEGLLNVGISISG